MVADVNRNVNNNRLSSNIQLSYIEYVKMTDNNRNCLENEDCLIERFKLVELKSIARQYRLAQSGKKSVISKRICNYFRQYSNSITIQRIFRGHMVRCWMANGFIRRYKSCVNETDGYTLEPLADIPMNRIVCIKERYNNHTYYYAFDVVTLLSVVKSTLDKKRVPVNIYTRNELNTKTVSKLILMYYIIRAIFPDIYVEIQSASNHQPNEDLFMQLRVNQRVEPAVNITSQRNLTILLRQQKRLNVRIEELFSEMHYLGNYVSSEWFKQMNVYECITFYEWLAEIWYNRMDITPELRQRISPTRDPLSNTSNYNRWGHCNTPDDVILLCVETMEYMVLDGVDEDARKIGAMYVLCAMTTVSNETRLAFPWLYDTIA